MKKLGMEAKMKMEIEIDHKKDKRRKWIKESYIGPLLWNRTFMAWAQLGIAIIAITIGIFTPSKWVGFAEFFIAGFLFQAWFMESFLNTYRRLNEGLLQFTKRVINDMGKQMQVMQEMRE